MDGTTVLPVSTLAPDEDTELESPTVELSEEESRELVLKAMHQLIASRRDRVVTGVVNLMMDTFITAGIPSKHFPGTETFKHLITQVRALMVAHDF